MILSTYIKLYDMGAVTIILLIVNTWLDNILFQFVSLAIKNLQMYFKSQYTMVRPIKKKLKRKIGSFSGILNFSLLLKLQFVHENKMKTIKIHIYKKTVFPPSMFPLLFLCEISSHKTRIKTWPNIFVHSSPDTQYNAQHPKSFFFFIV